MTVLKRRCRREDSDYDVVEVRVLLEDVGLCLHPSARNGDRDTIPYALADALEMAGEGIEYRSVGSGEGWRNADDGGAPVRFGGEPPLDPGLVERLMDEENLKSGEVDHGEPLYFVAANSQASRGARNLRQGGVVARAARPGSRSQSKAPAGYEQGPCGHELGFEAGAAPIAGGRDGVPARALDASR